MSTHSDSLFGKRRTKIVATLGPASSTPAVLAQMIAAGMDVARFNLSHGSHQEHRERVDALRLAMADAGREVAVLVDLRGPEVRLLLPGGKPVSVKPDDSMPLPRTTWDGFAEAVEPGDRVLLADGTVEAQVAEIPGSGGTGGLGLSFTSAGVLRERSKVVVPGLRPDLPPLSAQDLDDIAFGVAVNADVFAMSFVHEARELLELRDHLRRLGSDAATIAKIETRAAYTNLHSILSVCDGAMVARGDLGVECSFEEIPMMQKQILALCNRLGKPGITATEMLESMTRQPRPTRAEASDVFNAVLDGTDALMLSGETAVGSYPWETVAAMSRIALQAERIWGQKRSWAAGREARLDETLGDQAGPGGAAKSVSGGPGSGREGGPPAVAIAGAAVAAADEVRATAIITPTRSGYTARMVSRLRPRAPIIAVSSHPRTVSVLRMSWGVHPIGSEAVKRGDDPVETALAAAQEAGLIGGGDLVVVTAGVPADVPGTTKMLQLRTIGEVLARGSGIMAASPRTAEARPAVSGPVVVVSDKRDLAGKFADGCVLAAYETNASFVPFMQRAAAVLTVEGGLSSHAAVVCLSLGKPVIVGVRDALRLPDGEVVTVDAARGVVYRGRVRPV